MRIACLHTAHSNVVVFDDALRMLAMDGIQLMHYVRADLLASAEQEGGLTPRIEAEAVDALQKASREAAVVLTCSTLGPAVDRAKSLMRTPVLRVDEALATQAGRRGGAVVALCTVATTLEPTRILFEAAARATGASVQVRLVPSAWDFFKAGNQERYLSLIADAADRVFQEGVETVALAQASMADAAGLCRSGQPLSSLAAGLAAAVQAAEAKGRGEDRQRTFSSPSSRSG